MPPPPSASHPGIMATDITAMFADAVKHLAPGQIVKDGHFTLFESVSALEIMDPKMDSGCLAEGESLGDDYDVSCNLLPEEVLGIIDQLLCLEVRRSPHPGYSAEADPNPVGLAPRLSAVADHFDKRLH